MLLGLTSHLAVTSQMLTTRLVYMRELTLVAPMGKLCQARFSHLCSISQYEYFRPHSSLSLEPFCSGNIKLVLVLGLKLGIISGVLDTFLR